MNYGTLGQLGFPQAVDAPYPSGAMNLVFGGGRFMFITSSTTFRVPGGVTRIRVTVIGGGESGICQRYDNTGAQARGGAGGGCAASVLDVIPGQQYSITIGAGGASASTSFTGGGNAGGTTSFGTLLSATGGSGGTGGTGSGGNLVNYSGGNASNSSPGITGAGGGSAATLLGPGVSNTLNIGYSNGANGGASIYFAAVSTGFSSAAQPGAGTGGSNGTGILGTAAGSNASDNFPGNGSSPVTNFAQGFWGTIAGSGGGRVITTASNTYPGGTGGAGAGGGGAWGISYASTSVGGEGGLFGGGGGASSQYQYTTCTGGKGGLGGGGGGGGCSQIANGAVLAGGDGLVIVEF